MAPIPQEYSSHIEKDPSTKKPVSDLIGDEIVISGISGIYPKSENVDIFMKNLYSKVDMVTSSKECQSFIHPDMPSYWGKVDGFDKFDSQFFRVPHGQAHAMDPMTRKLLEHAYGAFFDAGVRLVSLAGTKLGVFVGSLYNDTSSVVITDELIDSSVGQYLITGCSKALQANRISYWIDGKGPSYELDAACSSSILALEHAYWAIKTGKCTSAIVGGANYILEPTLSLNLRRAGLLCLDGKTKCFDRAADGYVRSEAISVMFLQRASEAKRIYAELMHVKSQYRMQPDANFLPIRKSTEIEELLHEFYSNVNVTTNDLEYVEACGTGVAELDAHELEAIGNIFAKDRSIKVGSVKSNMGHSEAASDMCALTKLCLAYHKGELPGNLHYNIPHDDVAGIQNGRIQVVTENVAFQRGFTAMNSFSYTGMNGHALLKGHYKNKNEQTYYSAIPRLILASGRINDCVSKIFDALKSESIDAERISLLHDFFEGDVSGHTFRGYIILDSDDNNKTACLADSINHYPGDKNPVWFLYSGMGSQWPGMGAELMKIPTFAASIERCRKVLEPKGIDIIKILMDKDETFDNILYSFVGIAAVQIGLTDLLQEMGIVPDNIIGHSVGEIGCAYADGCLSTEETILAAYYRGLVSLETKFTVGLMAAVGLGYKQVSLLCPPEVEVACHNSSESSTISGPAEIVKKFVQDLKSKNIFAKFVSTANIAYHSKWIAEAGPKLRSILKTLIETPKLRSEKWICTSVLEDNWNKLDVKYASAEYFTNNLLSSVFFEEAASNIPANATIIEISPHGLLQAIMRRSHQTCNNIPLTNRANSSPLKFFLESVGKLYQIGLNPKINILYPKVQYPVSTETPMLSSLVGWSYDNTWMSYELTKAEEKRRPIRNFVMILDDDNWKYIKGHKRNDVIIFPEAALIALVWETLAMYKGVDYKKMSVKFESIKFIRQLYVKEHEPIRFAIGLQMGINRFEIYQEDSLLVSGFIYDVKRHHLSLISQEDNGFNENILLKVKDIYELLENKGHSYGHEFQSILSSNNKFNKANVIWTNEWVPFIDSLIQLNILSSNHDDVLIPKSIRQLSIDTNLHNQITSSIVNDDGSLKAFYNNMYDTTRCGGVEIIEMLFNEKPVLSTISDLNNVSLLTNMPSGDVDVQDTNWLNSRDVNLIQVSYAGLSMNDYQHLISKGRKHQTFGMDFSGCNYRSEKVMGLVSGGALANTVKADPELLWPVPDHWSLEDAATVPLHYALAYYCLNIRGYLEKNDTVLVLGGAGALGQAVISICLALNCTVFTTVSNDDKKEFLLKLFPQLREDHILNCNTSDTLSFYAMIAQHTNNLLCNYVISCAAGEIREQAMKCVGSFGSFMDINIHDKIENMAFGMSYCWGGRTYMSVDLSSIFLPENLDQKTLIYHHIKEGIAQGIVKPLCRNVFLRNETTRALKALASEKRKGKVVVSMKESSNSQEAATSTVHKDSSINSEIAIEPKLEGLRVFYNYIEHDEIQASEPIVKFTNNVSNFKKYRAEELDSSETHLIMIPGFEGHSRIFCSIGEMLKIQAVSLQLAPDLEGNSIQEMAATLYKCIKRTFQFNTKFYILAFSFGVNIALELAALLEKEGYLGVVYCLDSSPKLVQVHLDVYLGQTTETELQDLIITDIYHLMSGDDSEMLNKELKKQNNWSDKVEVTLKMLRSVVTHSHDYQRAVIESMYKRIKLSKEYEPNLKLESELVLIKGTPDPKFELAEDYNLSNYSKKPVKVFQIETDHVSAPYSCQVSNIVNKMLEPQLLEAYNKINQCEFFNILRPKIQRKNLK